MKINKEYYTFKKKDNPLTNTWLGYSFIVVFYLFLSTYNCLAQNYQHANDDITSYFINQSTKPTINSIIENLKSNVVLDSIEGHISHGILDEKFKTYFTYNSDHELVRSQKKYFTTYDEYREIFETTIYTNGRIKKKTVNQLHRTNEFSEYFGYDSAWVKTYYEINELDNDKIIHKLIITKDIEAIDTSIYSNSFNYHYKYDDEGVLKYSVDSLYGRMDTSWYFYYENNKLKFRIKQQSNYYYAFKNEYKFTDSIETTIISSISLDSKPDSSYLEFIDSYWSSPIYFRKYYDDAGRLISETRIGPRSSIPSRWSEEYSKIEYTYNNQDQLSQMLFYTKDSTTGPWYETQKFSYTYNSEGNLKQYEKLFFDTRFYLWRQEVVENYYYTTNPNILDTDKIESRELKLYPVPASNYIEIGYKDMDQYTYQIFNIKGQNIDLGIMENSAISINRLPPGIYFIHFQKGNKSFHGKFMKSGSMK